MALWSFYVILLAAVSDVVRSQPCVADGTSQIDVISTQAQADSLAACHPRHLTIMLFNDDLIVDVEAIAGTLTVILETNGNARATLGSLRSVAGDLAISIPTQGTIRGFHAPVLSKVEGTIDLEVGVSCERS